MKKLFIVWCIALLSSCAFIPQQANIDPVLNISEDGIKGRGSVVVNVLDERPTQSLGRKSTGYGPGAEITAVQDLSEVIKNKLNEGLIKKGFDPFSEKSGAYVAILNAEIRFLQYSTSRGFWSEGRHMQGAIKIKAENNGIRYEKLYRVNNDKRAYFETSNSKRESLINTALSNLLNQIINDIELINLLSEKTQ